MGAPPPPIPASMRGDSPGGAVPKTAKTTKIWLLPPTVTQGSLRPGAGGGWWCRATQVGGQDHCGVPDPPPLPPPVLAGAVGVRVVTVALFGGAGCSTAPTAPRPPPHPPSALPSLGPAATSGCDSALQDTAPRPPWLFIRRRSWRWPSQHPTPWPPLASSPSSALLVSPTAPTDGRVVVVLRHPSMAGSPPWTPGFPS